MIPVDMLKREVPKPYIDRAITLISRTHAVDVLEIGCMRQPLNHPINETHHFCCGDGHSSYVFVNAGINLLSVDINPVHLECAKNACSMFPNTRFVLMDAFEFVNLETTFDAGLLFLDAWDVSLPLCAENHLAFWNCIKDKINDDCLILIDDTDLYWDFEQKVYFPDTTAASGKGKLLVPYLLNNGYKIIFTGRQTLLKKAT